MSSGSTGLASQPSLLPGMTPCPWKPSTSRRYSSVSRCASVACTSTEACEHTSRLSADVALGHSSRPGCPGFTHPRRRCMSRVWTFARSMAELRREMLREAPSSVCLRKFTLSACTAEHTADPANNLLLTAACTPKLGKHSQPTVLSVAAPRCRHCQCCGPRRRR